MKIPLQITYRDFEPTAAIDEAIRSEVASLERVSPEITSCRVLIETPHRHSRRGRLYQVHVDLTLPGVEIIADRLPCRDAGHGDFYIALRDAFRSARREIHDFTAKRRDRVRQRAREA